MSFADRALRDGGSLRQGPPDGERRVASGACPIAGRCKRLPDCHEGGLELFDQVRKRGLSFAVAQGRFNLIGQGRDSPGPDSPGRSFQRVGRIRPLQRGATMPDEGPELCGLRLEESQQLALERPVAGGLAAKMIEVEHPRIVQGAAPAKGHEARFERSVPAKFAGPAPERALLTGTEREVPLILHSFGNQVINDIDRIGVRRVPNRGGGGYTLKLGK
jgi:hypothetical protein